MELKNIFKMTKTDRYTQDGRDELAKLQETEDVKYKTGDISQKTGLQKQPDGSWAPPKKGGAAPKMGSPEYNEKYGLTKRDVATGKEIDRIYEKHQKRIKELKAKGYTDEQIENDKIYQQTKEDMRNVGKSKPAGKNGPSRMEKEEAIRKDLGLRGENDLDRFSDEQIEMMYQKSQRTPEQQKADFDNSKLGQAYNKARKEYDDHQAAYKNRQRMRDAEKEIGVAESLERMYESRGRDTEAAAAREYRNAAENLKALTGLVENLPRNTEPDAELQQKIQDAQKKLDEARVKARPQAAGDSAPRELTGDTRIRIKK